MKKTVYLSLALMALLYACNIDQIDLNNIEVPRYNGVAAFPIGETSYTLEELISDLQDEDTTIQIDPETDLLFIEIFDEIDYEVSDELVNIGDVVNLDTVDIPTRDPVTGETRISIDPARLLFEYSSDNGERIELVEHETGNVRLVVSSNLPYPINFDVEINNTTNPANGNASLLLSSTVIGGAPTTDNEDISGWVSALQESEDGTERNIFNFDYSGFITLQDGQEIPAGAEIYIELIYENQTFNYIEGYFGQDTVEVGRQTTDISIFDDLGGGITFRNPQIILEFENSVGVPSAIDLSNVYGLKVDSATGIFDTTYLVGVITRTPQKIENPEDRDEGFVEDVININAGNSNINQIFAAGPQELVFDIDGITNPDNDDNEFNFFQPGMQINTDITFRLDMVVQIRDMIQEIDFKLGDDFKLDETDSAAVRIVTINQLPLNATLLLQLVRNDTVLFEADEKLVVATPFLNSDYRAIEPEENIADILLPPAGIEALNNADRVRLKMTLNTPESLNSRNIFVELFASYYIDIKVGIVGRLDIEL